MKKTLPADLLAGARSAARRSVFNLVSPTDGDKDRKWFNFANAKDDVVDVYIMDEIGYWGVTAGDFSKELSGVSAKTMNLYVNSPGGSVFDGLSIHGSLIKWAEKNDAKIIAHVDGWAASIASVIIMAADEIRIAEAAQIMAHPPSSLVWGTAVEMRAEAEILDSIEEAIIDIYTARTGGDRDEITAWVQAETWFKGQAAVDAGFADVLVLNKKKDGGKADYAALATRLDGDFLNSIFPNMPDDVREALTKQPENKTGTNPPKTTRELAGALRNIGYSRDAADSIAAHGFKPKEQPRAVAPQPEKPTTAEPRDGAEKRDAAVAAIRAATTAAAIRNAAANY